jgi:hypothetical protein
MKAFEPLIGKWHGEGEIPIKPPMRISVEAKVKRLGEFIVFNSVGKPADVPDSVSIIGGAPEGDPQPMYYSDARGVKRLRRGLERPARPRLQPALHRRDLG